MDFPFWDGCFELVQVEKAAKKTSKKLLFYWNNCLEPAFRVWLTQEPSKNGTGQAVSTGCRGTGVDGISHCEVWEFRRPAQMYDAAVLRVTVLSVRHRGFDARTGRNNHDKLRRASETPHR